MTIPVNLIGDGCPVVVDDRSAELGGSFYYEPLRPYSPLPLKWCYEQLMLFPKATLIDVGASTGCFSLLAKHHPDLTVYAFEPVSLTYRVLLENIYLNDLMHKVEPYRSGVSNYDGTGILHSIKNIGGSGVSMVDGKPAWHKDCDDLPIEVVTLDTFCAQHKVVPTFIKIDTEGNEKAVLLGAAATIQKYHPFLLFETSAENTDQYGYNPHELVKLVEDWGYQWRSPEGLDLWCVHKEWESLK